MPIKSEQQRRFMAMCLHSPEKAKDKCPPKSVAKKFIHGHKKQEENSMNYIEKYFLNLDETASKKTPLDSREGVRALFESVLEAKRETIFENSVITFCEQNGIDYNSLNEEQINELIGTLATLAGGAALAGGLGYGGYKALKGLASKYSQAKKGIKDLGSSELVQDVGRGAKAVGRGAKKVGSGIKTAANWTRDQIKAYNDKRAQQKSGQDNIVPAK